MPALVRQSPEELGDTRTMLSERLRELRLRHGMTLRELAAKVEVSPALLSQLENRVTDPSLSTLRKLATVFKDE